MENKLVVFDDYTNKEASLYSDGEGENAKRPGDCSDPIFLKPGYYYRSVLSDPDGGVLSVDYFNVMADEFLFDGLGI